MFLCANSTKRMVVNFCLAPKRETCFCRDRKRFPTHDVPLPIVLILKGKAGGEGKLLRPSLRKDGQKLGSTKFVGILFLLKNYQVELLISN